MKPWILAFAVGIMFSSCDTLQEISNVVLSEPSNSEIIGGLKQALEIGIGNGSEALSKVNGYFESPYKILLPDQVQKVTEKLQVIPGFKDVEMQLIKKLNQSAEDAAKSAKPIFVDAIRGMTFDDALSILMGADNAATSYLEGKTRQSLYDSFQPVILESLNKFNAVDYWEDAVNTYNKIPLVEKVNPRLDDHVTAKALDGLFAMVTKEEQAIRKDPAKRVTDLLKKVFAKQDKTS